MICPLLSHLSLPLLPPPSLLLSPFYRRRVALEPESEGVQAEREKEAALYVHTENNTDRNIEASDCSHEQSAHEEKRLYVFFKLN